MEAPPATLQHKTGLLAQPLQHCRSVHSPTPAASLFTASSTFAEPQILLRGDMNDRCVSLGPELGTCMAAFNGLAYTDQTFQVQGNAFAPLKIIIIARHAS